MTCDLWKSALVAAFFALHPLNVESVAWVAERKSVISTLFFFLTIIFYATYTEKPNRLRYLAALSIFALGLMAKPMLVTLPFVLLLLDYWPLSRMRPVKRDEESGVSVFHLVLEKVPFLFLSGLSVCISSLSVQRSEIMVPTELVPLGLRLANGMVSYVIYLWKMIWPSGLAVFYPYPEAVPLWRVIGAGAILMGISLLVVCPGRSKRYLVVGWLWYLGTLLPVMGLIQAGLWPAMADRFAYIPLIGVFIMIAWGGYDLLSRRRYRKVVLAVTEAGILSALIVITWLQVKRWETSITLFEHALRVTSKNAVAHNNLGDALNEQGKIREAAEHFSEAVRIDPRFTKGHYNLGTIMARMKRWDEAMAHLREVVKQAPKYVEARINLGNILAFQGALEEAAAHFEIVLSLQPDHALAHYNLGNVLAMQGQKDRAVFHYSEALRIRPDLEQAERNLKYLSHSMGGPPVN
jgi:Tfp pilus assembly protein PilF